MLIQISITLSHSISNAFLLIHNPWGVGGGHYVVFSKPPLLFEGTWLDNVGKLANCCHSELLYSGATYSSLPFLCSIPSSFKTVISKEKWGYNKIFFYSTWLDHKSELRQVIQCFNFLIHTSLDNDNIPVLFVMFYFLFFSLLLSSCWFKKKKTIFLINEILFLLISLIIVPIVLHRFANTFILKVFVISVHFTYLYHSSCSS